jgi:hypothetical protein
VSNLLDERLISCQAARKRRNADFSHAPSKKAMAADVVDHNHAQAENVRLHAPEALGEDMRLLDAFASRLGAQKLLERLAKKNWQIEHQRLHSDGARRSFAD